MIIDERIEALTQSVELLSQMHQDNEKPMHNSSGNSPASPKTTTNDSIASKTAQTVATNEATDSFELTHEQLESIRMGMAASDAGRTYSTAEVLARLAKKISRPGQGA